MSTLTTQSLLRRSLFIPLAALLALSTGCRVEQETTGRLPDVDVEVEPGRLPRYDVEGPEVKVGTVERTVTVPRVEVVQEQRRVQVPYVDVNLPGANRREQTLTATVRVPSGGYNLDIQNVYMVNNELWVVAELEEENPNAPRVNTTVADRIVVKAPEMPVRYYIIGEGLDGTLGNYRFINNRQAIQNQLNSGRQLYRR